MESLFEAQLREFRGKDLYRTLRTLEPIAGNRYRMQGKDILLFCGNDYLGLSRHPAVIESYREAALSHGAGAGAARLISGSTDLHEKLEEKIAVFKLKPRALLFSAGYLANLGTLAGLAGEGDLIVMDKLCHASLIDGAKLSGAQLRVFPHKNYRKCEDILQRGGAFSKKFLVTDSVFSMDGDLAGLEELVRLKKQYDCFLIVDDAHTTGVLGKNGRGSYEDAGLAGSIDVITGTLSKALGCFGGFAAASDTLIETLINRARPFIFATALPPAICGAALAAFRLIEEDGALRARLWDNIQTLEQSLKQTGFETGPIASPIFPLVIGEEKAALAAAQVLLERGLLVPAIRYPTVAKGKARLRLTVNSLHTKADMEEVLQGLKAIKGV